MASILKENNLAAPSVPSAKLQAVAAKSDAEHVREFTAGAGQPTPNKPVPMDETEVDFITKMVLDEVMELLATVYTPEVAKKKMCDMIGASKDIAKENYDHLETPRLQSLHQAAAQADALVDVYYYMQNAACKKGMNLSAIFQMVHGANMAKRDPATGQFIKRADGKIIKPAGWKAPDVEGEVIRQDVEGSFN
ncbi:hypothetical protein TrVE_jg2881 [Triparma verrucosa]|uniref:Uncharacterized protein n=1 Tax=Triparma verrucosa TaxID=1606542 RepID=A0A9W7F423_9STRA|nr:hypothetical protein TrVE_jg2881 [Triparma verrucosa]|mmetsp:Transcript_2435/g.4410  ORF Transcript_2435/g.4410 Transcript_2435/m.4410 type:complete len:193 (+) Transcript_2435:23-601(+)